MSGFPQPSETNLANSSNGQPGSLPTPSPGCIAWDSTTRLPTVGVYQKTRCLGSVAHLKDVENIFARVVHLVNEDPLSAKIRPSHCLEPVFRVLGAQPVLAFRYQ